jgi:putative glutamine amidotransferase
MNVRIAIPEPTSSDPAYNARSLPPYIAALQSAGATPVIIPLHERPDRVARLLATVHGTLLPGSGFDIAPEKFGAERIPECNAADPAREAIDELLLEDAFSLRKPLFAICFGVQSLNVWLHGTLIQDLEAAGKNQVNHRPGRHVNDAHTIEITPGSLLARLADKDPGAKPEHVNSSHHQALLAPGNHLRVTAVSPVDQVIEAVELDAPESSEPHFVLGVQWHPERTYTVSSLSRALFAEFIRQAADWKPWPVVESPVVADAPTTATA